MEQCITVQQAICAPTEKVWQALTDPNEMKKWYFDMPDFAAVPGHVFSFEAGSEDQKYYHELEILEVDPNKKLVHTWTYPELSQAVTTVEWTLEDSDGATLVTLKHSGVSAFSGLGKDFRQQSFENGWQEIVTKMLRNHAEN